MIEFKSTKDNTWVLRITADRRIEVNEDVNVNEAAQKVLDAMQSLLKPQQRKPLTIEQIEVVWSMCKRSEGHAVTAAGFEFARAIESAHGIKE